MYGRFSNPKVKLKYSSPPPRPRSVDVGRAFLGTPTLTLKMLERMFFSDDNVDVEAYSISVW